MTTNYIIHQYTSKEAHEKHEREREREKEREREREREREMEYVNNRD